MSIVDTINKAQRLDVLEKGVFQGNQHVDADGGGIEYHPGVKGAQTFTSITPVLDGVKLTAAAEVSGLFRVVVIQNADKKEVYRSTMAFSDWDTAMAHGRQVLSGAAPGLY